MSKSSNLSVLASLSLIAGGAAGLLAAVFRLALERADRFRDSALSWAHSYGIVGFFVILGVSAITTALAAWLVRCLSPHATGSGIPHVEAQLNGKWSGDPLLIIPVKFMGGLLALGAGLALGREGPSVQMGATLAHLLGQACRRSVLDCRVLLAAGAGAGLATAFNSPIAGAVFVLEELVRRFDIRTTIATLGASAGAIAMARVLLGDTPDFHVAPLPYPSFSTVPIHLALGVVAGFLGIAYNHALLGTLGAVERLRRWPVELRAALVGAAVGLVAWFKPGVVGGGNPITQRTLAGTESVAVLALVFILRFGLGAVSYAARTPGGLFAPMLVLGSQSGLLFGIFCNQWFPIMTPHPVAFGVVGMAAFFAAVVRAPLTGIILVTEMTASFTLLLPMLGACFAAMVVPTVLHQAPIYDSLRERALR